MSSNLDLGFPKYNLRVSKSFPHIVYEFDDFRFEAEHLMLYHRGEAIPLAPKAAETLLALIERRGKIVSKEELIDSIWPDAFVEESNLFLYLSILRKTLGTHKDGRSYLETLRRRGYRFNGDVRLPETKNKRLASAKSSEATRLYLLGRYHAHKLTDHDYAKAIEYFEEAISEDPFHTLPHAGITISSLLNVLANDASPSDRMPRAKIAALRAVELDPECSEAHIALGSVALFYDWDWATARDELKRACDLDPNSGEAASFLAHYYSNAGRHDEAIELSKRAAILDPLNLRRGAQYGQFLYYAGRYDDSIEQLTKLIELEPNFWLPYMFISRAYLEKGMFCEVENKLSRAIELGSTSLEVSALRACAYARSGETAMAKQVLSELTSIATQRYVPPYFQAMILSALGDRENSLFFLEKSINVRDARATWLKVDPKWKDLTATARFKALLSKMGYEGLNSSGDDSSFYKP